MAVRSVLGEGDDALGPSVYTVCTPYRERSTQPTGCTILVPTSQCPLHVHVLPESLGRGWAKVDICALRFIFWLEYLIL